MRAALISIDLDSDNGDATVDFFEGPNPVIDAERLRDSVRADWEGTNRVFVVAASKEAHEAAGFHRVEQLLGRA